MPAAGPYSSFTNPPKAKRFAGVMFAAPGILPKTMGLALRQQSEKLAGKIRTGIRKGAPGGKTFAPLRPDTIRRKKSSKPLIDKGDLVRSVKATRLEDTAYLVGVHRRVPAREGGKMVNIAAVLSAGSEKNNLPPRPFIEPTFKKEKDDLVEAVGEGTTTKFFRGI